MPSALLTSWEGWRRIKWEKHHQDLPQTGCRARRASLIVFFSCSTAWFVAREGLCVPHLCASLARTPRARGLGCKVQFVARPLVPGLQRVTPAAFSSLPSHYILRLKERFCSRACSSTPCSRQSSGEQTHPGERQHCRQLETQLKTSLQCPGVRGCSPSPFIWAFIHP